MKSNIKQLKSRGYIEESELQNYNNHDKNDLLTMLTYPTATQRTAAAKLLAKFKELHVAEKLMQQLKIEKKLYSKIAITETLASYGELSCNLLIDNLGLIGNNQHTTLPNKKFNKSNYPLPRDISARTLCKIGKPAIFPLIKCFENDNVTQISEAIDALGYISYYENDNSACSTIICALEKYKNNDIVVWKLLRAMQAFRDNEIISILEKYVDSNITQHRLEAIRSINQIKNKSISES